MRCIHCGKRLDSDFCAGCGAPVLVLPLDQRLDLPVADWEKAFAVLAQRWEAGELVGDLHPEDAKHVTGCTACQQVIEGERLFAQVSLREN